MAILLIDLQQTFEVIECSIACFFCRQNEGEVKKLSKEELETMIEFLYRGEITCDEKSSSTSEILLKLTEIFGFPDNMKFDSMMRVIKSEEYYDTGE